MIGPMTDRVIVEKLQARGAHPANVCHPVGWDVLVSELDAALAEIDPGYKLVQSKEKFGGLRFYFECELGGDAYDRMRALVDEAEAKSCGLCMDCGEPGSQRGERWIYTLCDVHEAERVERRKRLSI